MLHVWAILIGAGAMALPLIVHFLTRARPVKMPLSTIRFVHEAVEQKKSRHKLRDMLVLACRIIAVAMLALAFSRPLLESSPAVASEQAGGVERIVILDVSASQGAMFHGATLFERARARAALQLRYEAGLRANLIFAGAKAQAVFDRASPNLAGLSDELGRAVVTGQRLNINAAIALAGELFQRSAARADVKREVVIISDMQRSNWSDANFEPLPKETRIVLETVAPDSPLDNVGITAAGVLGRVTAGQESMLEVELANFSRAMRKVQIEANVGGRSFQANQECPPGARVKANLPVVFAEPGWQVGQVRLAGMDDALAADNVRTIVARVLPAPAYLLVTRQSAEARPVSSHFLQRALVPQVVKGGPSVLRIAPAELDRESIAAPDMVVLDHPGKLDAAAINLLASSLRRGKPILYAACEPVDATNLKMLADAAGTDLRMPVEFRPAAEARIKIPLGAIRKEDPVFAVFGEQLQTAIDSFRFSTLLSSVPNKEGVADDVIASYADRTACLVVTACGSGTLAVFNTDLGNSNISISGASVAILGELTSRLLKRQSSPPVAIAGEAGALVLAADAAAAELSIAGADGKPPASPGQISDEQGAPVWRWNAAPAPGAYTVTRGKTIVAALAVAMSPEESDLTPIDQAVVKSRLAGGRSIEIIGAEQPDRPVDRAWVYLGIAAAMCLLSEFVVLRMFRT